MAYLSNFHQAADCIKDLEYAWETSIRELKIQAKQFGGTGLFGGNYSGRYASQVEKLKQLEVVRIFLELCFWC